jgi:hypothetical protein
VPLPALKKLKRLAKVEHQFRMTVRYHSLGRGVFAVLLQSPEALDERLQRSRRPDLSIADHPRIIALKTLRVLDSM